MKNTELKAELTEMLEYFFATSPNATGISFSYNKKENHGKLTFQSDATDKSYTIILDENTYE